MSDLVDATDPVADHPLGGVVPSIVEQRQQVPGQCERRGQVDLQILDPFLGIDVGHRREGLELHCAVQQSVEAAELALDGVGQIAVILPETVAICGPLLRPSFPAGGGQQFRQPIVLRLDRPGQMPVIERLRVGVRDRAQRRGVAGRRPDLARVRRAIWERL